MRYAYEHLDREIMVRDASFRTGPEPGDIFPELDLPIVGGGRISRQDLRGRPVFVVLASYT